MKIDREALEDVVKELFTERRAKILLENPEVAERLGITPDKLIFSPIPKEDIMEWAKSTEVDPRVVEFIAEPMGEGKGFPPPRSLEVVKRFRRRTYL